MEEPAARLVHALERVSTEVIALCLEQARRQRLAAVGVVVRQRRRKGRTRHARQHRPAHDLAPPVLAPGDFAGEVLVQQQVRQVRGSAVRLRDSLQEDGIFVLDAFGGTEAMEIMDEDRKIPASIGFDGRKIPAFTYVWDQARFNAITHELVCHIHFKFSDGTKMKRAFTYDWRLWTLPELQEILLEAGFSAAEIYLEGWDEEEDEADGIFRRRTYFENIAGWVGYVVGVR